MSKFDPLPKRLRGLAGEMGLKQIDIARYMGVSHTTAGDWWNGVREPTRDQLLDIEELLEADPGDLAMLAGYLPGDNPKVVERGKGTLLVSLETSARSSIG